MRVPSHYLLVLLLASLVMRRAAAEDSKEDLQIEATVSVPLSRYPRTTLVIAADGATRVSQDPGRDGRTGVLLEFRLAEAELERARQAVIASRFHDDWGTSTHATDQPTWRVQVRLGDRLRDRPRIYAQPEFAPLEAELFRFVEQAQVTAELRRGESSRVRHSGPGGPFDRLAHPAALVPELVACAAGDPDPARGASVAAALVLLPSTDDWMRGANALLERLEGDRRAAVLTAWVGALRPDERAAHRAAFAPIARAEVDATWRTWPTLSRTGRSALASLLEMEFREGAPHAFDVAERMARTLSAPGAPVIPPGLLATGAAAVPTVLRLLEAEEPDTRAAGAEMAHILVGVARKTIIYGERLSDAEWADLDRRVRESVVPALERRTQDAAESYALRNVCLRALDAWDGRVKAAAVAAGEAAAAERRRAEAERAREAPTSPPLPTGTLTIAGRLLSGDDVPLPGFRVDALLPDGRSAGYAVTSEEGWFRVTGLAAGTYSLFDTGPGDSFRGNRSGGPGPAEGVAAGTEGVQVRLPGSLIRGRLLDASGAPARGQRIVAQMRDAPSHQGPAYGGALATTDPNGRFHLVRLLPGVYDLELPGHPLLRGATGIGTGPTERTVEMLEGAAIAGRLVDETGAPMADTWVTLTLPDAQWTTLQSSKTDAEGRFRLARLDPSRRYRVYASLVGDAPRPAVVEDVPTGTEDLLLRIDGTPRLRFRVAFGDRGGSSPSLKAERVSEGPPLTHEFRENPVNWPAAPPGTWKVFARVRDVDAQGGATFPWIEIGTVTTGEAEKSLTVPR